MFLPIQKKHSDHIRRPGKQGRCSAIDSGFLEVREARAVVEAVKVQDLVLRVPARRRRLAQLIEWL